MNYKMLSQQKYDISDLIAINIQPITHNDTIS